MYRVFFEINYIYGLEIKKVILDSCVSIAL